MKNRAINDEVLLPCPFCGGEAALSVFDANASIAIMPPMFMYRVACTDCNIRTMAYNDKQIAISRWNQRTKKKRRRLRIRQKQKGGDNAKQTQIGMIINK